MPIYDYECENCSCRFEVKQSFDDESLAVCPKCKKRAKRVFTPVPIIFKGTGFYVTDHRGSSSTLGNRRDSDKPADTGTKENTSKENVKKAE